MKKSRIIVVDQAGAGKAFRSINEAAKPALPGDTVLVRPGIYREHVAIERGGTAARPLTIRAETPGTVFVRGSEPWSPRWKRAGKSGEVFEAPLPWDLFTSQSNPFLVKLCVWDKDKKEKARPTDIAAATPYSTDFPAVDAAFRRGSMPSAHPQRPADPPPADRFKAKWKAAHDRPVGDPAKLMPYSLGQIFHQGRELVQSQTEGEVRRVPGSWILSRDGRRILLHFPAGGRPGDGALEITVRDRVFSPARRGLEHVILSGFVFEHCGNQGPFPQNGMVSTRSGSFWVIENNIIRFAKTIGLDCGDEYWVQEQIAYTAPEDRRGYSPRNVIIRNNLFCDNGLTGISALSSRDFRIVDNVLERNNALSLSNAYECGWEEQASIKLHGANGTLMAGNLVRNNCAHGIWIDSGNTRSRISRNVIVGNEGSGIYIEVGKGKTESFIDNNIVGCTSLFFNFRGGGITIESTSDMTIAHNLVFESFGPAVCAAAAEHRPFPDGTPATASDEKIFNNIFISNHGNVELPFPHPRSRNNRSDRNVYVNAGDFRFWRSRAGLPEILRHARGRVKGESGRAALRKAALTGGFSPEIWPGITGWEKHSLFLDFTWMTCFLKPFEPSLRLRADSLALLRKMKCRRVPGVDRDFCGTPIKAGRVLPGPFQDLRDGDNYYLLFPKTALGPAGR